MAVLPGPLPDGRRSGGDEGLGSRLAYGWFSLAAMAFGRIAIRTWPCLVLHDLFSVGGVLSCFSTKTLSCSVQFSSEMFVYCRIDSTDKSLL